MSIMSDEELQEYKTSLSLLSADELRAQLGSSDEEDAVINEVLAQGKAVETKGSKSLQEGEETDNEQSTPAVKKPEVSDEDDDEDDGEEEDDDEGEDDAAKAAAATKEEQEGTAAPEKANEDDAPVELPKLDLSFLNTEHETKLQELDAAKADKLQELMDGVINAKEYAEAEAKYMRDRDALREEKAEKAAWFTEVHEFKVEAMRSSGINYVQDQEKAAAWDDWVKRLAAKPENAGRDGKWFLEQAHKKVMAEFDIAPKAGKGGQKPAETVAEGKKVAKSNGRAPNLSNIPPTLGGLPAAADNDSGDGGEFAHIDKLSGMAYERALAAMSPDQKARYEAM